MALDPQFFAMQSALDAVWNGTLMDLPAKQLVSQCLSHGNPHQAPAGEHELGLLHFAVQSCNFLRSLGSQWLTPDAARLPEKVKQYIDSVAIYYHQYAQSLPGEFIDSLCGFIRDNPVHIGTLNYDNLLYNALITKGTVGRYDQARLVDGFWMHSGGFKPDNLERQFGNDFGWYMHLHGSPLFYDHNSSINKFAQGDTRTGDLTYPRHVVLTHIDHKQSVILNSELLKTYWYYLVRALSESKRLILFGYSGQDKHLNLTLSGWFRFLIENLSETDLQDKLTIVEWDNGEERAAAAREVFWRQRLELPGNFPVDIQLMSNILAYRF